MKNYLLAVITVLFPVMLSAQRPFPTEDEIKQFTASKTCVVLEIDQLSFYNVYIQEAVKEYWTVTPYEFISNTEFNVRRSIPEYSFIVLTETSFDRDKSKTLYNFINLLQGKNVKNLAEMPEICAIPLSFSGEDAMEYGYKLGAILSFMQKHALMIAEDPSLTGMRYLTYYNKFVPEIINKTILVKQEDLAPAINNINKIKAIYSHNIEIVDQEDIQKAIEAKTPNTLILHKVGPSEEDSKSGGYCFKILIGTDDAKMYYYNQHLIDNKNPNGFLPSDLKRLARFN